MFSFIFVLVNRLQTLKCSASSIQNRNSNTVQWVPSDNKHKNPLERKIQAPLIITRFFTFIYTVNSFILIIMTENVEEGGGGDRKILNTAGREIKINNNNNFNF